MTRPHTPARQIEELEASTRFRLDQAFLEGAAQRGELGVEAYLIATDQIHATPALDTADLFRLFQTDRDAAWAQLTGLSAPQLVIQAYAMAAWLLAAAQVRDITADGVLVRWQTVLARKAA